MPSHELKEMEVVRRKAWVSLGAHLGGVPMPWGREPLGIWGQSPILASQPAWLGLTSAAGMAGKELAFGTYEVTP